MRATNTIKVLLRDLLVVVFALSVPVLWGKAYAFDSGNAYRSTGIVNIERLIPAESTPVTIEAGGGVTPAMRYQHLNLSNDSSRIERLLPGESSVSETGMGGGETPWKALRPMKLDNDASHIWRLLPTAE